MQATKTNLKIKTQVILKHHREFGVGEIVSINYKYKAPIKVKFGVGDMDCCLKDLVLATEKEKEKGSSPNPVKRGVIPSGGVRQVIEKDKTYNVWQLERK